MNNLFKKLLFVLVLAAGVLGSRAKAQVVIANNSVKAADVSKSDMREVFTGASAKLADGSHVTPVLQKSGAVHVAFLADYVGKTDAALNATWRSLVFAGQALMPKAVESDAAMVEYVARTPGAIGYIAKTSAHEGVKILAVR